MHKQLLILVLSCLSTWIFGQDLKWIYNAGGSQADYGNGLAIDSRQNICDIVVFRDSISIAINEKIFSKGSENVIIRKSTSLGVRQWYHQLATKGSVIAHDIIVDKEDNVYVTGVFTDSLFYLSEFILKGSPTIPYGFLIKIDENGTIVWSKQFTSDVSVTGKSLSILPDNKVVLSGHFEGNADFGDFWADTTSGYNDIFIIQLDPNGTTNFFKKIGGSDHDFVSQHISDRNGNTYLIGDFRSRISFAQDSAVTELVPNGQTDVLFVKLRPNGDLEFAKAFGGSGIDAGASITMDGKGDIILTGRFSQTVNFGGSTFDRQSKGGTDIFLMKMDSTGITQWVNTYGDTQNDAGIKVTTNNKNVIILTGTFRGKVDFNASSQFSNNSESNGNADIFYAIYNQDGSYNLHYALGGMAEEQIGDIGVLLNGDIISVGGFGAIVDFDLSSDILDIYSNGGIDAFLLNVFTCINPYLKTLKVEKSIICPGENIFIQVEEGYLNSATQWSWQRHRCENITFASGDFLSIPIDTSTSFFVKGFGGCVLNDECQKVDIKIFTDSIVTQDIKLCEGDTLYVGSKKYFETGTYIDTIRSTGGCDSIIISHVGVFPAFFISQNIQICNGDSIRVGSNIYTLPGSYTDPLLSIHGCDSTVITHLSILPATIERIEAIICKGDTVTIQGVNYDKGGIYIQSSPNPSGCEDMLIINIIELETEFSVDVSICEGDSLIVGDNTYSQTGIYVDVLKSNYGCDSIITTNLTVNKHDAIYHYYSLCQGDSIIVNGQIYKERQYFIDSLNNIFGCDSIIFTSIDVLPPIPLTVQEFTLCEGETLLVGTSIYSISGIYLDTLISHFNGCDSVVETNLNVLPRYYGLSETICEGQQYTIGSVTLDKTGIFEIPLSSSTGCDSIVVLNLTVVPESFSVNNYKICPGESVIVGSSVYTIPGSFTDTLSSVFGCDSIVASVITYNNIVRNFSFSLCEGESVSVNNIRYSTTGIYMDSLRTSNGCDSVLIIQITSNPKYNIDTLYEICKGQSVTVGNTTYSNAGNYREVLTSKFGCDSIINFRVEVVFFEPSITVTKDTLRTIDIPGATYQWYICRDNEQIPVLGANSHSFTFSVSGNYAIEVTYKGCSYLSTCLFVMPTSTSDGSVSTVQMYPNPFNEQLNVIVPEQGKLRFISVTGIVVQDKSIQAGESKVETHHLLPGMYIVEWTSSVSGKFYRRTFVKY